jgi:hypothetical protein
MFKLLIRADNFVFDTKTKLKFIFNFIIEVKLYFGWLLAYVRENFQVNTCFFSCYEDSKPLRNCTAIRAEDLTIFTVRYVS